MIPESDIHIHTTFCDGKSTPEEMIIAAIEKGLHTIGFSGHSYTPFDLQYCMKDTSAYLNEVHRLKSRYDGIINVLAGVECDMYGEINRSGFDFIIGSVHYIRVNDKYYPIDNIPDDFRVCLDAFGGDIDRMIESYYETAVCMAEKLRPDVIGHFDLITKFNDIEHFFDESTNFYCEAVLQAAKKISKYCNTFEVNTGAVSRGYKKAPYPSAYILKILLDMGCDVILTSDSHKSDNIASHFSEAAEILRKTGFRYVIEYNGIDRVKVKL